MDSEKKGQWWLSGDVSSTPGDIEDVAAVISKEVVEAQKLVQLAAAQRMNTDIRRAIFCIIMSAEDYVDAFDKILRLDLSGKQVCIFFLQDAVFLCVHESISLNSSFFLNCCAGSGNHESHC